MVVSRELYLMKKRVSDAQLNKEFRLIMEKVRDLTESLEKFSSSEESKDKRIARARTDVNYFAKTYLPHYFDDDWADCQVKEWPRICAVFDTPQVVEAVREGGKSAYFGVMLMLHSIVFRTRHYLLSVGETVDKSKLTTGFVQIELLFNPRIRQDFGALMDGAAYNSVEFFVTKTDICVQAVSVGQDPRGLRWRQYRPDFVIADDVQNKKRIRGRQGRKYVREVVEWFTEDMIPALAEGYWFSVLGTAMASKCVIRTLAALWSANYHFYPAIKKGKLMFPQRYPQERLDKIKRNVGSKAFNQEFLGAIEDDESFITEEKVAKYHPEELLNLTQYIMSWFDPSSSAAEVNCFKAIITLAFVNGIAYVLDAWVRHASLDTAINHHFAIHGEHGHRWMWFEDNGAQANIEDMFKRDFKSRGIHLPIKGITNIDNKIQRITTTLQSPLERGLIRFNPGQGDQALLIEQLVDFPGEYLDGPDALEGVYRLGKKQLSKNDGWRASHVG